MKQWFILLSTGILTIAVTIFATTHGWASDKGSFSYDTYGAVLMKYVDDKGLVDYKALKANRGPLDTFAESIATLDPKTYDSWSDKEKIAFLINAYNALTLVAIIDNYPIQASFFRSFAFPENSIRQIAGVWDELQFGFLGGKETLDGIEHEILRKKFNEPRIHMALVCAAKGCPVLRNEPFVADRLDEQLDDQSKRFMNNPKQFKIDRSSGTVYLSSIFKWFGEDFVKTYGTDKKFTEFDPTVRAVLNFASKYVSPEDREALKSAKDIEYLDYDWSLNEQ